MDKLQEKYKLEIEAIVRASNYIAEKQYVTSHGGNLSYRVDKDVILITPTKVSKKDITFDEIVIIDSSGKILFATGGRKPTGEMPFHLNILEKRPDFNALLHAHPPVITGLAIAHSNLLARPLLPEPIIEIGPVLSVSYAEPLSQDLADAFDAVLHRCNAFLMLNHGILLGAREGMNRAVEFLEMLETTAQSAVTAATLGNIVEIPEEGLRKLERVMKTRNLPMPGLEGVNKSLVELYKQI
jgi:L-fuculose-phosphate aldolase